MSRRSQRLQQNLAAPYGADEESALDAQLERMIADVHQSDDPVGMLNSRIDEQLGVLVAQLAHHRPERVVELARVVCLPWQFGNFEKPNTDGGPPKIELLALFALVASTTTENGSSRREEFNGLFMEANEWVNAAGALVQMSQALLAVKAEDNPLERVATLARGREVWVRNTSYPDMVARTHRRLFDDAGTAAYLRGSLGFNADEAARVLSALNQLQSAAVTARLDEYTNTVKARPELLAGVELFGLTLEEKVAFNQFWQPTADVVAFSAADVDALARCGESVVKRVLDHFSVSPGTRTSREILDAFASGDNPLRTHPVLRASDGRYILVHEALVQPAVRENLEQTMRADKAAWEPYQKRRGTVLEEIGKAAFESMLPGVTTYFAFDYFIPENEAEELLPPERYTKKVEGDILFVIDDVAIIVEAKAVAITPDARAGVTSKLRRNLADIVTTAANQASRLRRRIVEDGGVRLKTGGWVELSHVREIHTVALSLEDLTAVATGTTALVEAGLLSADEMPWVVSIHDLQIIAQLIDRPADLLLYLRRRRDPEMPVFYRSVDELDLFLFYLDAGLYVAPDPKAMAAELSYASADDARDLRLRERQRPAIIHPRTRPLDAWHQSQIDSAVPKAPKPHRTARPLDKLAAELAERKDYGWLSIGATLLAGDTDTQKEFARIPRMLFAGRRGDGQGRSRFADAGNRLAESWALIWVTRPRRQAADECVAKATTYLRDKKYQTRIPRGAAFIFDEHIKRLVDVIYDGETLPRSAEMDEATRYLEPLPTDATN